MKKTFAILLVLLEFSYSSKPADLIFNPISLNIWMDSMVVKSKIKFLQKKPKSSAPFQGKRIFCSADSKAKYLVTIKRNSVLIVIDNTKVTGLFKKDKLFTNDPEEIEYRRFSGKYNFGKFYVIGVDYFSVLNPENGEYRYYTLCK
jgi:hypothetical protein